MSCVQLVLYFTKDFIKVAQIQYSQNQYTDVKIDLDQRLKVFDKMGEVTVPD